MRKKVAVLRMVAFILALTVLMGAVHPAEAYYPSGTSISNSFLIGGMTIRIATLVAVIVTAARATNWGLDKLGEWVFR